MTRKQHAYVSRFPRPLQLKLKTYSIVSTAVELGVQAGYTRAHKHTSEPTSALIIQAIYDAVMLQLDEVIAFEAPQ